MSDPVTNAQQMENSRNDGPPPVDAHAAANQWRLHEMTGGKYTPTLPKPEAPKAAPPEKAYADQQREIAEQREAERDAKLTPAEQRIKKANANPALWDTKHRDHEAARTELREAVAAGATPEEQQAMQDAPLSVNREAFGLTAPSERVLPKIHQEEYEQEYGGHEQDFLVAARQHGLDSKLVGELRDAGIRMAMEAEGRAVSDEAWGAMQKKFAGRLTATQFMALKAWWRGSVEKGA